jgi:hypothetical protein
MDHRELMTWGRADLPLRPCHEKLTQLRMRLLGDRVSRRTTWQIARERGWASLREAEHLAVARLEADAFATVDPDMVGRADSLVRVATIRQLESAG